MKMEHTKKFPLALNVFSLIIYAVLNGLGLWQLERYHDKIALHKQFSENREASIIELEHLLSTAAAQAAINQDSRMEGDTSGIQTCLYRRVAVEGRFLHEQEIHLYPRTYEIQPGQIESGFHVITPFQLNTGGVILVNRGWAPLAAADLNTKQAKRFYRPKVEKRIIVTIFPFPKQSYFSPPNDLERNRWFSVDMKQVAKRLSLMTLMPVFSVAEPYTPEGDDQWMPGKFDWPVVINKPMNLQNNHLEYAATWYMLSLIWAMMFLYYYSRWHRKNESVLMGFKEFHAR